MVKFSKQLEAQIVPEWKEAFVDYWQLKKELKKIHLLYTENTKKENQQHHLFSKSFFSSTLKISSLFGPRRREKGSIQVHKKMAHLGSKGDMYETELLEQFDDGKEFFRCLDVQLNKVNQFYRMKEKEFSERGDSLKRQMEILIELKNALKQQQHTKEEDDEPISGTVFCDEESNRGGTELKQGIDQNRIHAELSDTKLTALSKRVISFQGKSLRIKIPQTNPGHTFSAINYLIWDDMINQPSKKYGHGETKLHISKTELRCAQKMIRGALIELYKGLGYLKTYRNLNMLAFIKILKKFDKNTSKQVLPIYLKVVESSYFNSSDKALKLGDEVEEIFIKHFSEDDKRMAMKYLKPTQKKDSHIVTFLIGLFSGCFVALLIGYVFMAHATGMYRPQSDAIYMETVYPVLSMFSLLFLHLFLYGCNMFMWRKARINYTFIFELSPAEELKFRDVFMICTVSMAAVIGVLLAHLSLVAKGYSFTQVQAIPGLLLLVFLALLVCPFNVIYKSSRYRLLRVLRNIVLSPLYKVVMLDFFMADQLCSQVPMLRNFEHAACYYITGSYKNQDYGYCMRSNYYKDLAYAVSFLPYYWRAMQCGRRWLDEGHKSHLVNLGKYVSAMLAAGAKVAYEKEKSVGWLWLLVAMTSAATVYQLYWDFVKDWGLLQFHSKNPLLRNELMLSKKFIYYFSMGLNLVLRLAWVQTIIHYNFGSVDYRVTGLFLAALEVIRRGQWNFYRLENEHLNNAGKFRAIKTVPLPFHEVGEED